PADGDAQTPPTEEPAQPEARDIGGPLILLGIGLTFSPILFLSHSVDYFKLLEARHLEAALHAKATPLAMGVLLAFEAVVNLGTIVAGVLMVVLFAQRRRAFPRLFIWYALFVLGGRMVDLLLGAFFLGSLSDPKSVGQLMQAGLWALLWITYLV